MLRFMAACHKELLLLKRDRSGLLVLFLMPALLVLVITLVQNNTTKTPGESRTDILIIDEDAQLVGDRLIEALSKAPGIVLTRAIDGKTPDRDTALKATAAGKFQVCLIVPKGMSASVKENARRSAKRSMAMPAGKEGTLTADLELHFDPALLPGFRATIKSMLQLMVMGIEAEEKAAALSDLFPVKMQQELVKRLGPMAATRPPQGKVSPAMKWDPAPILGIREATDLEQGITKAPNAVQQNVPAWSLFGVFFIVLPMAGSFVKERLYGIRYRLTSFPVSYLSLTAGKVAAYMLVCLVQFILIFCIGKWIFPLLGLSSFDAGSRYPAIGMVAVSAIFAATGYGILLGTAARTYEQASMFGAISIVIASAIGGIMVPVWAMPVLMQKISAFSPLAWAQNAFVDILVRGESGQALGENILRLFLFAMGCILVAWVVSRRNKGIRN